MTVLLNGAVCAACVAAVAVGVRAARGAHMGTAASAVGAGVWVLCLVAWAAYAGCGFVECSNPLLTVVPAFELAALAVLTYAAPGLHARLAPRAGVLAAALLAVGVPVAFLLLELPYNERIVQMDAADLALNLALLTAGLLCCWLLFQRSRWGVLLFVLVCLVFGLANYFLCLFKEQTVLPADVLALGTAAQVSAGYSFVVTDAPVAALCVFLGYMALVVLAVPVRLSRRALAANFAAGLALVAALVGWYGACDLRSAFGVTVDVWSTRDSYMKHGSVPSFLQRMQELEPKVPAGYTAQGAAQTRSELAAAWDEAHPGYPQTLEEAQALLARESGLDRLPHVVVVMNESFSDLSMYPGVTGYAGTPRFDAVDAALRGLVYTSVRGGGTCNSEFEFLTGATLGSMGGGVYPYMFYDLTAVESLPKHFAGMGYATVAVHPEHATNWRRDVVYRQLGFERFLAQDAFAEDAQTLRGLVTDRETYDVVLDLLREAEGPQFVFDVTLQNHGGYETGQLDAYPYDAVRVGGVEVAGMSEYLSCIDASQVDLAYFLDELAALGEPVLVVFFGDHQPGFNDAIAEAAYGVEVDDLALDQVQQRFAAPYFVWATYPLPAAEKPGASAGEVDMSLGYLMATAAHAAGLPLSDWQKALLQLQAQMPAVNLNGYMDDQGVWYWIGQDGPAAGAYGTYALLQHDLLFGTGASAR